MEEIQIEQINDLTDQFGKDPTNQLFNKLFLKIKVFFRQEEELYKENNHPDFETHAAIHGEFERVLFFFCQSYFTENNKYDSVLKEFCFYIKNWLQLHSGIHDNDMMPFVRINQYINNQTKT